MDDKGSSFYFGDKTLDTTLTDIGLAELNTTIANSCIASENCSSLLDSRISLDIESDEEAAGEPQSSHQLAPSGLNTLVNVEPSVADVSWTSSMATPLTKDVTYSNLNTDERLVFLPNDDCVAAVKRRSLFTPDLNDTNGCVALNNSEVQETPRLRKTSKTPRSFLTRQLDNSLRSQLGSFSMDPPNVLNIYQTTLSDAGNSDLSIEQNLLKRKSTESFSPIIAKKKPRHRRRRAGCELVASPDKTEEEMNLLGDSVSGAASRTAVSVDLFEDYEEDIFSGLEPADSPCYSPSSKVHSYAESTPNTSRSRTSSSYASSVEKARSLDDTLRESSVPDLERSDVVSGDNLDETIVANGVEEETTAKDFQQPKAEWSPDDSFSEAMMLAFKSAENSPASDLKNRVRSIKNASRNPNLLYARTKEPVRLKCVATAEEILKSSQEKFSDARPLKATTLTRDIQQGLVPFNQLQVKEDKSSKSACDKFNRQCENKSATSNTPNKTFSHKAKKVGSNAVHIIKHSGHSKAVTVQEESSTLTDQQLIQAGEEAEMLMELMNSEEDWIQSKLALPPISQVAKQNLDEERLSASVKQEVSEGVNETKISESSSDGFKTANGKRVVVSEDALNRASRLFAEVDNEGTQADDESNVDDGPIMKADPDALLAEGHIGFATASGKKVSVSAKALENAEKLFAELKEDAISTCDVETNGSDIPGGVSLLATEIDVGFATASGRKVSISPEALKKAEKFFVEIEGDVKPTETVRPDLLGKTTSSAAETGVGFATARGKKVSISPEALKRAEKIFAEEVSSADDGGFQGKLSSSSTVLEGGFSTARGKKVTISQGALKKAEKLLSEVPDENEGLQFLKEGLSSSTYTDIGFATAGGKKVSISPEALEKAEKLLSELRDEDDGFDCLKKDIPSSPSTDSGFATAGGKKRPISPAALEKAEKLLSELQEEATNTETDDLDTVKLCSSSVVDEGVGFATASGKMVPISPMALKRAKIFFADVEEMENPEADILNCESKKNLMSCDFNEEMETNSPICGSRGANTGGPSNRLRKFTDNLSVDAAETDFGVGFATAGGRKIAISDDPLERARKFFTDEDKEPVEDGCEKKKEGSAMAVDSVAEESEISFSTASGKKVVVSVAALNSARTLFSEDAVVEEASSDANDWTGEVKEVRFATASGKKVVVSEDALRKVRNMFADDQKKNFNADEWTAEEEVSFATASGKKVAVSDETLRKVQGIFAEADDDLLDADVSLRKSKASSSNVVPAKDDLGGVGFATASGKKVAISEHSLKKARLFFVDVEEENSESDGNKSCTSSSNQADPKPRIRGLQPPSSAQLTTNMEKPTNETYLKLRPRRINEIVGNTRKVLRRVENDGFKVPFSVQRDTPRRSKPTTCIESSPSTRIVPDPSADHCKTPTPIKREPDLEELKPVANSTNMSNGFSTASGKNISISEEALLKAKAFFEEVEEDKRDESTAGGVSDREDIAATKEVDLSGFSEGFSTASGRAVKISEDALRKVKHLFDDADDDSIQIEEDIHPSANTTLEQTKAGTSASSDSRSSAESSKPIKNSSEIEPVYPSTSQSCDLSSINTPAAETTNSINETLSQEISESTAAFLADEGQENNSFSFSPKSRRIESVTCESSLEDRPYAPQPMTTEPDDYSPIEAPSSPILGSSQRASKTSKKPRRKLCARLSLNSSLPAKGVDCSTPIGIHTNDSSASVTLPLPEAQKSSTPVSHMHMNHRHQEKSEVVAARKQQKFGEECDENMEDAVKRNSVLPFSNVNDSSTPVSQMHRKRPHQGKNEIVPARKHQKIEEEIDGTSSKDALAGSAALQASKPNESSTPVSQMVRRRLNHVSASRQLRRKEEEEENSKAGSVALQRTRVPVSSPIVAENPRKCEEQFPEKKQQAWEENDEDDEILNRLEIDNVISEMESKENAKRAEEETENEMELRPEVSEARKVAAEEQAKVVKAGISSKKGPKMAKGSLFTKKTSGSNCRRTLKSFVGSTPPERFDDNKLRRLGVDQWVLDITSENAAEFRFNAWNYYSADICLENVFGLPVGDGARLILNDEGTVGLSEVERAFLASASVDPALVPAGWVRNHYRWIVWKLAAYERRFPSQFASRCLTPHVVMQQLKYRYDREIDRCQRPALRKILEHDDSAARRMVLCVASVKKTEPESGAQVELELTDGWYSIKAAVDSELQSRVLKGTLKAGTKIVTHGAELVNCPSGCPPLEMSPDVRLKIASNSTRRARWYATLGFQRDPRPFRVSLSSILANGGTVGCITVYIARIYPVVYLEKNDTGRTVVRCERAERREASLAEMRRQKAAEQVYVEAQAEVQHGGAKGGSSIANRTRHITRQALAAVSSSQELSSLIESAADPAAFEKMLSEEQLGAVLKLQREKQEKLCRQVELKVKERLQNRSIPERNVTPVLKVRLVDEGCSNYKGCAVLSIWRPTEDMAALFKESQLMTIYNLNVNGWRAGSIQLSATRATQYVQAPRRGGSTPSTAARSVTPFADLYSRKFFPVFGEVDVVGVVIRVDALPASSSSENNFTPVKTGSNYWTVYFGDEEQNVIAVAFWGGLREFGVDDIVSVGAVVAMSNLQWRGGLLQGPVCLYAQEVSVFTINPRMPSLRNALSSLQQVIKSDVSGFVRSCEEKLENFSKSNTSLSTPDNTCRSEGKPGSRLLPRNLHMSSASYATPTRLPDNSVSSVCGNAQTGTPAQSSVPPNLPEYSPGIQERLKKLEACGEAPPLPPLVMAQRRSSLRQGFRPPRRTLQDDAGNTRAAL